MSIRLTMSRRSDLPPADALAQVLDLRRHRPPLTTITAPGVLETGSTVVARTALGRWGFDDVMHVTRRDELEAELVKTGSLVMGRSWIQATPTGRGSVVTWHQEIGVRGVPDVLVRFPARVFYRMLLRRSLR